MNFIFPTREVYLSRSPISIGATATGQGETFLSAIVKVYLWNGTEASKPATPTYTLNFPTGSITGAEFKVDISEYIQSGMRIQGNTPTALWGSWFSAEIQAVTTVEGDTGSSVNCIAVDGYSTTQAGQNNAVAPQILLHHTPESVKNGRTVTTWAIDKTLLGLGGSGATQTTYAYKVKHYNIQSISGGNPIYDVPTQQEVILDGATNTFNMFKSVSSRVEIGFINGKDVFAEDGNGTVMGDKQRITPDNNDRYSVNKVVFVNSNGTLSTLYFNKARRDTLEASRETFTRVPDIPVSSSTFNAQIGGTAVHTSSLDTTLSLTTGWVEESVNELIKELLVSKLVFLEYETGLSYGRDSCDITVTTETVPVIVDTNSVDVLTAGNDKVISYTIDFALANTFINNRF